MRERHLPPRVLRRLLRGLLSGARGTEVVEHIDREYAAVCARSSRAFAGVWYLWQLFRTDTWRLAWVLRRVENAGTAGARQPRSRARLSGLSLDMVRVRGGDADGFAHRARQIIAALDADFRLSSVANLAAVRNPRYLALAVAVINFVLGTVLLLTAAGIHALMSLTVTRRRKEIGIRTALGARPGRVLANIFSRAAWQLGLGGVLGGILGGAPLLANGVAPPMAAVFLGGVVALMLTVGLAAAAGPARRGLGIQPMEALKEE